MDVKKLFGEISGTYDLLNRVLSLGTDQKWRKKATELLPHGETVRILDLASGTLDLALFYLEAGSGAVYAVDFAYPMLVHGRIKTPPTFDSRLHLICADGLKLPFSENFFDAAICGYGMRNLPDNAQGLAELQRVLKPSAPLILLEFFRPSTLFAKAFSQTYGKFVIPALGRIVSHNPNAYQYLQESIRGFYSLEEYKSLLKTQGFQVAKSRNLTGGISSLILAHKR